MGKETIESIVPVFTLKADEICESDQDRKRSQRDI